MYFIDDEHKRNFETLLFKFPNHKREDAEYLPTIYLAAFPEIFKCIDVSEIDGKEPGSAPLLQLTEANENGLVISHPALTSGSRAMVQVGISLYNNHEIALGSCLASVNTKEWQEVLFQAIKLRMNYKS